MKDLYTALREKRIRDYQIDLIIAEILITKEVPEKLLKNMGVKTFNV